MYFNYIKYKNKEAFEFMHHYKEVSAHALKFFLNRLIKFIKFISRLNSFIYLLFIYLINGTNSFIHILISDYASYINKILGYLY